MESMLEAVVALPISGLVSEDEFLDFAGGGAGDGGEDEAGGDFVGGEMLTTPLLQLLGAGLRASGEFDEGAGDFAPLGVRHGDDGGDGDGGVFVERFFDFYRGDVFAAGDDDVFGAIFEFDVAVGVGDGDVARMKPAASEGFLRGAGVAKVAFHDDVAAKHDFAEALAVVQGWRHGGGVHDFEPFQRQVAHALARFQHGLLFRRQVRPVLVPFVDCGWAVSFG